MPPQIQLVRGNRAPRPKRPFVELCARSAFSFLGGASLPEDLIDRAAELELPAIALVDRAGVYGAPRFYQAARAAGVRAIVGAGVPLEPWSSSGAHPSPRPSPHPGRGSLSGSETSRLVLPMLVRDRRGYKQLCKLLTTARLGRDRRRWTPEDREGWIDWRDLEEHACGGHVALVTSETPLARMLATGDETGARRFFDRLLATFGRGNLFVAVARSLDRDEEDLSRKLEAFADAVRAPIVASAMPLYAREGEAPLFDVLTCLRRYTTLDEAGKELAPNGGRQLRSYEEMRARWRDRPDAVERTVDVAEQCAFTLEDLGYRFPEYPIAPGETLFSRLHELTFAGARDRYRPLTPEASRQLSKELDLIAKLDLAGYFLVVHDVVDFCRRRGILAQGRGSAANSAVCYALGITAVDPVKMDLLFERFLSEDRGEWPDIDIDLPSGDQRESVIQHLYEKYGKHGAAMTATVVTYRGRSAVRDVGKVLGFPEDRIDKMARVVSHWGFGPEEDLSSEVRSVGLDPSDRRVRAFMDVTRRIRDLPRHLSQHPGGMVISGDRLDGVVPLEPATMPDRVVVQWDKDDCASLGIIKVDLLGLGMLSVLERAVPLVREHEGVEVDLAHLPQDDPKTYEMMQRADTVGVFQIESRAQMATLPRLRPKTFYDLVVEVAIIRPGPIVGKLVNPYINRRLGREAITYPHPLLEPILKRTLGVALFQEQLMRIAMVAAGFTGSEAQELRRAMSHKRSMERIKTLEKRLRDGMAERGIVGKAADDVVLGISSFALYGFPESHAASFALIAYASAYLKAHHPACFAAALLDCWPMGFYHPMTLVKDAQRHGVRFLPIDVTCSEVLSLLSGGGGGAHPEVRLGLRYVVGLRAGAAERIVAARREKAFESLVDVARRADLKRDEMRALAELGALANVPGGATDARTMTRREALWQVTKVPPKSEPLLRRANLAMTRSPLREMTYDERLTADLRASTITIGQHPIARIRAQLRTRGISTAAELPAARPGTEVKVAGAVIVRQRPQTAKGFFFVTLEDETGFANAIVAPRLFEENRALLSTADGLVIEGVVQTQDHVVSVKAARFEELVGFTASPSRDFH
ncbi:MAG: error-prone DNA polymerase [Deltaproteobacteria bacterium]|nr:error-prone DNA polymerase [Deltaproteobacteria bacterium]